MAKLGSSESRSSILFLLLLTVSVQSFSPGLRTRVNFCCRHQRPSLLHPSTTTASPCPLERRQTRSPLVVSLGSSLDAEDEDEGDETRPFKRPIDTLVADTSRQLKRISWLSWWSQMILTVTSAVILTFARNVVRGVREAQVNFFLAGSGIVVSFVSIFWTWGGGARLSRRLLRKTTPKTQAANMLRRAIKVGVTLNLAGMALTLIGAEQTVGVLAIKVLSARPWSNAGGIPLMATNDGLQPLDILVVQANTNVLFSHFCSLVALLYLTRFVKKLDPPSTGDYERQRAKAD